VQETQGEIDVSRVEEIEAEIERLPREQFLQLLDWLRKRFGDEWDGQFGDDVEAGRLDPLAQEALAEYRAGKTRAFPAHE
jgi:hypothetical protein